MRVAILCPYSLSVPGGVQGQVLGLARSLRGIGVATRVIGPTDGPPPEPGVVTVGVFAHQRAQICLLGTPEGVQTLNFSDT